MNDPLEQSLLAYLSGEAQPPAAGLAADYITNYIIGNIFMFLGFTVMAGFLRNTANTLSQIEPKNMLKFIAVIVFLIGLIFLCGAIQAVDSPRQTAYLQWLQYQKSSVRDAAYGRK